MFENVLVGVDGRPNGRDAIALASHLTGPDGQLTLAHVHSGRMPALHPVTPADELAGSHDLLERERTAAGVNAELASFVSVSPGRGLHQLAEEQNADLLVVGSCSHGLFGRVMLGDDTRAALNGAPCAVAIAARGYAEHPTPIGEIGVGYDGSQESNAALAAARKIAQRHGVVPHALEVVSLPTYAFTGIIPPLTGDSIDLLLEAAANRMKAIDGVQGRVVYGLTGEELAAFSDQLDLLVVGSRSYGPWRRLVLGSTSDYLERHAHCSVLVLPRAAGDLTIDDELHDETAAPATA